MASVRQKKDVFDYYSQRVILPHLKETGHFLSFTDALIGEARHIICVVGQNDTPGFCGPLEYVVVRIPGQTCFLRPENVNVGVSSSRSDDDVDIKIFVRQKAYHPAFSRLRSLVRSFSRRPSGL